MSYLPGATYSWQTITSTPTPQLVSNKQIYVCRGSGTLNFRLPITAVQGYSFQLWAENCHFNIVQSGNQTIKFGDQSSTPGSTGGANSTKLLNKIEVVCIVTNDIWEVSALTEGNINLY